MNLIAFGARNQEASLHFWGRPFVFELREASYASAKYCCISPDEAGLMEWGGVGGLRAVLSKRHRGRLFLSNVLLWALSSKGWEEESAVGNSLEQIILEIGTTIYEALRSFLVVGTRRWD